MYRSGIQLPKVSFSSLTYDNIGLGNYFIGFNLDSAGKLSKMDKDGNIVIIEGGGGPIEIQEGGTTLTDDVRLINFTGAGVSTSVNGQTVTIDITGTAGTVSSVGLQLGTSGTDANISNSPITSSGNIILNLPTASSSVRGLLSTTDWATFNSKQNSITLTTIGTSGPATLVGSTLNIPNYTSSPGTVRSVGLTAGTTGTDINITGSPVTSIGTLNINIPDASASARGALTSTDWSTFNGKIGPTRTISTTTPLQGGGDLSADRTLSILQSSSTTDGYLSSADWNIFNGKVSSSRTISTTAPLQGGGDLSANRTLSILQSSATVDGYLSSIDWNIFNGKVSSSRTISTTAPLQGGGDLSANRTLSITQASTSSNGYLSSTDWNTFNGKIGGSGTVDYVARFTGAKTLDIGIIQDDGNTVGIKTAPASDSVLSVAVDGINSSEEYVIKAINNPFGGNLAGITGIEATASNSFGGAIGGRLSASSSTTHTAIGAVISATNGTNNYSVQLQDGTEGIGKFLKSIDNDGSANWANIQYLIYSTRLDMSTLISTNSLIPGMWYYHEYAIQNHLNGGIDSSYKIILQAVSSNKLSIKGHRLMRVPKIDVLQQYYFNEDRDYYIGDVAVFGNGVYQCILDATMNTLSPRTYLDSYYFQVIPDTDNDYYETKIFDIVYNWDYASTDWQWSEDMVQIQSDSKGNIIRRTQHITGMFSGNYQQSSIDLHEWNNPNYEDNHCYGIWYNRRLSNPNLITNKIKNNKLAIQEDYTTSYNGPGIIWRNKSNLIEGNQGGSIYQNYCMEISRNNCMFIYGNSRLGSGSLDITDNEITSIYDNSMYGPISSNRGKYYRDYDGIYMTKIHNNVGTFELGIVDNDLQAGGRINYNSLDSSINGNSIYAITQNGTESDPMVVINDNAGKFIIKDNQQPTKRIFANTIKYSYNPSSPYSEAGLLGIVANTCGTWGDDSTGTIAYNHLLEGNMGILNNQNLKNIIGNRIIEGIWNNDSTLDDINYNDVYSIKNNS